MQEKRLKFDFSEFSDRVKAIAKTIKLDSMTIELPFFSFNLSKVRGEKKIAKDVIIILRDKRVLKSKECCGSCIESAINSLKETRAILLKHQVEIEDVASPLFLLFDIGLYGIKTFLTHTEKFDPRANILEYYDALANVRQHLLTVFYGVYKISGLPENFGFRYDNDSIKEIPTRCIRSEMLLQDKN